MPTCYILCGVPGSGKSTWITNQNFTDIVIASTDNYVEEQAKLQNKTYNEVFHDVMEDAVDEMAKTVVNAVNAKKDIVWDQTSTSVYSRKKKLRMLTSDYKKIAVVFLTPDEIEHQRRLNRPGKHIPAKVMNDMIRNFVMPTHNEGFDEIIVVK